MLDGDDRVAVFDELMKNRDQLFDVDEVQAARGLVEDVEGRFACGLGEVAGELDALGLAAAQRRRAAAEGEVAEAYAPQGVEAGAYGRHRFEQCVGLFDGECQDLGDVQSAITDL